MEIEKKTKKNTHLSIHIYIESASSLQNLFNLIRNEIIYLQIGCGKNANDLKQGQPWRTYIFICLLSS